jgi:hypothetical protein
LSSATTPKQQQDTQATIVWLSQVLVRIINYSITNNTGETHMRTSQYFFLIGAVIELVAGVTLLAVYNNSLGYMGLIGSALLMAFIPLSNLAE